MPMRGLEPSAHGKLLARASADNTSCWVTSDKANHIRWIFASAWLQQPTSVACAAIGRRAIWGGRQHGLCFIVNISALDACFALLSPLLALWVRDAPVLSALSYSLFLYWACCTVFSLLS